MKIKIKEHKPIHSLGEEKIIKRFAFLPIPYNGYYYWLQMVTIRCVLENGRHYLDNKNNIKFKRTWVEKEIL